MRWPHRNPRHDVALNVGRRSKRKQLISNAYGNIQFWKNKFPRTDTVRNAWVSFRPPELWGHKLFFGHAKSQYLDEIPKLIVRPQFADSNSQNADSTRFLNQMATPWLNPHFLAWDSGQSPISLRNLRLPPNHSHFLNMVSGVRVRTLKAKLS